MGRRDVGEGMMMTEDVLEPDLPIIDPHHHLWDFTPIPPRDSDHPFGAIVKKEKSGKPAKSAAEGCAAR